MKNRKSILDQYQQCKIPVIHPESGNEEFVVVQMVKGRELIKYADMVKYNLFGMTRTLYEKLRTTQNIVVRCSNGTPRKNKKETAYIDLAEFVQAPISISDSKAEPEEVFLYAD